MSLLVSGGHTLIILVTYNTSFKIIANTIDRGVGAAIDHIARDLGLKWADKGPGAALEQFCLTGGGEEDIPELEPLNRPFEGLKFSFCGIQSQFNRFLIASGGIENTDIKTRVALARTFQTGVFSQLVDKVILGLGWCRKRGYAINHLVVSGGVASNIALRERSGLDLSERYEY